MQAKLCLLGMPKLEVDGKALTIDSTKSIALLAYVLMKRQTHARESIATLFWGELPQDRSFANLRQVLFKLKDYLPEGSLNVTRKTVAIVDAADIWVDVKQFNDLVDNKNASIEQLRAALDLYQGEFMSGVNLLDSPEFDRWQQIQRQTLRDRYETTLDKLINYYQQRNEINQAIDYAKELATSNPLNEANHRRLMQFYLVMNQAISAINQYHICTKVLQTELNISPGTETIQLYQHILQDQNRNHAHSISPQKSAHPTQNIYPPRPELAIGRDEDIARLRQLLNLHPAEGGSTIVVQGWPGVGKSALVALLAHDPQINERFPDGILWTALGEAEDVIGSLTKWAMALGMTNVQSAHSIEQIMDWLRSTLRNDRTLLIVDDVWTDEVAQYFRIGGKQSALVFTTRFNDIARAIAATANDIYKLDILDEGDSLRLLARLAPDIVASYPDEALELVKDLEGLPLGLQVAGRLLQSEIEMGWDIRNLLDELRAGTVLLKAKAPTDRFDLLNGTTPTISTLLEQSTNRLNPVNRLRFALLGMFAPKPATFGIDALKAIWEVDDPKDTIRLLVGRGLMEPAGKERFQVHALLIAHAKSLFSAN